MRVFLFIFIAVHLFTQCSKEKLLPSDYIRWVDNENNQISKIKTFDLISFEVKYRTIDYIISKEFKTNNINKSKYNSRYNKLEGMLYFSIRIKNKGKDESDVLLKEIESENEYFERVNYYSFDFKEDISLIYSNDTLSPSLYNFVRTHGVAPYVDFVFAFPNKNINSEQKLPMEIIINDIVFNNGRLKFKFTQEELENIPELIIN